VTAVVFDVGETLVDETRNWEHVADVCGVPWGYLDEPPDEAIRIRSLDELPAVLP
jgi:hypothetical protein